MNGSKHLQFLVENDLLDTRSLPALEAVFADSVSSQGRRNCPNEKQAFGTADDVDEGNDRLLLQLPDAKKLASVLHAPELLLEVERAIIQVGERQEEVRPKEEE